MALNRDDLVSGLREGLTGRSYMDKNTYTIVQFIEFIDKNVNEYGTDIKNRLSAVSKVGGQEFNIGELVAWCDFHLNKTVPDLIRQQSRLSAQYQLIRHVDTGAVYAWSGGQRPIFYHVKTADELLFGQVSGLMSGVLVDAETNLVTYLRGELLRFATDKTQVQDLVPTAPQPGPTTYTVVAGDTFSKIAGKLGVTVDALRAANPLIKDINLIEIGQVLNVPK